MSVLTLDLGTSATKAALWNDDGLVRITRAPLETRNPAPDHAEQDPESWWTSVVTACADLRAREPTGFGAIAAVGFSAARQTFALFDEQLRPIGPGVLWSDHRAAAQAERLPDPATFRRETGLVRNGGVCAAKVAWVAEHRSEDFRESRWVLAPRDMVFARLTGEVLTDTTLCSRTGWYTLAGTRLGDDAVSARLPTVVPPTTLVGAAGASAANATWRAELGLPTTVAVVIGAGDRACEVLGVGASAAVPMVSWGTTANVSVPHPGPIEALPTVAQVSRAAASGFLIEAGLSASGEALDWLARLTGRTAIELIDAAATVPAGSLGLVALPWLNGARAPWWRPDAHAAFTGLTTAHGPAELARATVEAIALDVARSIELVAPDASRLALAGGGADSMLWRRVLAAATNRPLVRRGISDAASVGARILVAMALGDGVPSAHTLNPEIEVQQPEPDLATSYQEVRAASDAAAATVLGVSQQSGRPGNHQPLA